MPRREKKARFVSLCLCCFATGLFSPISLPLLHAADSAISSVLETSQALVDIQSVNASVVSGKPRGFLDKATGQILITRKLRQVGYSRSGSGVILDSKGIIVTNAHTIRGAGGLAVTLFEGTRATVKDVTLVPGMDIAFLTVDPPFPLTAIRLADSDTVKPGTSVYTIGHSPWLKGTVMGGKLLGTQKGTVSGKPLVTALKLNFDMEKGDSGCPVLNAKGELLGIVAASFVGRRNATLAIPSNLIAAAYQDRSEKKVLGT